MRHYEIVLLIHPDNSAKISNIIDYYTNIVKKDGKIHRLEDWGRRQLAYPIKKLQKAHYILMNVEISTEILSELKNNFRLNDAIMRNMIMNVKDAITQTSSMLKTKEENNKEDINSKKI